MPTSTRNFAGVRGKVEPGVGEFIWDVEIAFDIHI